MAGTEDTELRDLVVEALEKNGSLAKVRALLRANIFLAFENEHKPQKHNPALDCLLASPEGALALAVVAEFLDFCHMDNTAYVYKAESRQGRAYRYDGRKHLPEYLTREYAVKSEPILVMILRQTVSNHRKKLNESPTKESRRDDDNCTYIVHDESGSTNSHSYNSSDDKNKLHLRLPLDNSDTDTSSDSCDKTSSEYIPNKNIQLDPDSEEDSKHLDYVLSPKTYMDDPRTQIDGDDSHERYTQVQNVIFGVDSQVNVVNSSDSYCDSRPKSLPKISNGNVENNQSPASSSLAEVSEKAEVMASDQEKQSSNSQPKSQTSVFSNPSLSQANSADKNNVQRSDRSKSETRSFNYSDDFSPVQESSRTIVKHSNRNLSPHSTESESIQEEISINGSDRQPISESPRKAPGSSHSSVSLSDVADMIEHSERTSSPTATRNQPVLVRNATMDEVAQRLLTLFRKDDKKRLSPKNSSGDISDSSIQSVSNISIDVHSD